MRNRSIATIPGLPQTIEQTFQSTNQGTLRDQTQNWPAVDKTGHWSANWLEKMLMTTCSVLVQNPQRNVSIPHKIFPL